MQSYDPFGETTTSIGDYDTDYGYTGEQIDASGLIYLRARYYDPATGRFVTRDPFPGFYQLSASQNGFSYVYNNPIVYVDPSGMIVPAIVGAVIAGAVIAGGIDLIVQYNRNGGSFKCFDLKEFFVAMGAGAVAGVVAFVAWEAILPVMETFIGEGLSSYLVTGAFTGLFSGQYSRLATNVFSGNFDQIGEDLFNPQDVLFDSTIGAVTAGLGYGIQKALRSIAGRIIQSYKPEIPEAITTKRVTSPGGRGGGPEHKAVIENIKNSVSEIWGPEYTPSTEVMFKTPQGVKTSRYADLGIFNPKEELTAIYQVGVSTKGGLPVSREVKAITDIFEFGLYEGTPYEGPILFIPYK